jgi:HEAT repeat protein
MPRKRSHAKPPQANPFDRVLTHLRDANHTLPAKDLYLLSDLAGRDLAALTDLWPTLPAARRQALIEDLQELGENNFEVTFDAVFQVALADPEPEVRANAVRGLWEAEDDSLIAPLVDLLKNDPAVEVRAAAASALGRYVYLGELEKLTAGEARRIQNELLAVIQGPDDLDVRRRALEALAFATHPAMPKLIAEAYASPELKMRVSAVFAMGRSSDERWSDQVLAELHSADPEIRFEAVRAAGELEIAESVEALTELTADPDGQVRDAAVWSLSQVGGDDARATLLHLLEAAQESEDDEGEEYIEDALTNLDFTDDMHKMMLFGLDEDQLDDLDDLDDLERLEK